MSLLTPHPSVLVTVPTPHSPSPPSPSLPCRRHLSLRCGPPPVDSPKRTPTVPLVAISAAAAAAAASLALGVQAFRRALPADFGERWRHLAEFSKGAESKVTRLPYHLVQAVLASEDRRFLYHFGFDPFGIGRAVVHYPNGGGGSTITQQLVKNVFLTNERKISRKFVEGILSLMLERRLSKWEILYSYIHKMYWGHGKYGIEAASLFYFGKDPSLLNVGESTLLAGILPSPETLNPITDPKRGKSSQARVLRRMVAAGFLDLETALLVVSQPIHLCIDGSANANKECGGHIKMRGKSHSSEIWDWELASILFEARENMEQWATRKHGNI